jgi:hypothetical protein
MIETMGSHLAELLVAMAGGLAALVFVALWLRSLLVARAERNQLRDNPDPTYIGGARFHATGGNFSGAQWDLTSPFAELQVRDDRVVLSLHDLGATLARRFDPPAPPVTILPFANVESFDRFANGGIRFRTVDSQDDRDGVVFWACRRDREQVVKRLTSAGLKEASFVPRPRLNTRHVRRESAIAVALIGAVALYAALFGWHAYLLFVLFPILFGQLIVISNRWRR